jgi:lysophospholipase L1-like esterase
LEAYLRRVVATDRQALIVGPIMPCWPNRFFGDGFHLNAMGAQRYTMLLAQWVRPNSPQLGSAARIVER